MARVRRLIRFALPTLLVVLLVGTAFLGGWLARGISITQPGRRNDLIFDKEELRRIQEEWERAWGLDQPSSEPVRVHGGVI